VIMKKKKEGEKEILHKFGNIEKEKEIFDDD
jgi:hypothetical protein